MRSRNHEPLWFCEHCRLWHDSFQLVRSVLGREVPYADVVRACLHSDTPAALLDAEIRWRERRDRFGAEWEMAIVRLREVGAVVDQLPFGEWGAFERASFTDAFPALIPSVAPSAWSMSRYSDHFLARLRRDEFFRPVAIEAYQHHRKRLFFRETVRFEPDAPPGFELVLPGDFCVERVRHGELIVTLNAGTAGGTKAAVDGWSGERPAVAILGAGHLPAARGVLSRISLVGDRPPSATLARRLIASATAAFAVAAPPAGALGRRQTFAALERPLLPATLVSDGEAGRGLRHRGHVYAERAGTYWRDGKPCSNFTLRPVRTIRRPDDSLRHELALVLADGAGEARLVANSSDFQRGERLYVLAWEAAIRAGLPPPIMPAQAERRLLASLVLALHEPPPLCDERPAVIDRFLALDPPVRAVAGRRLIPMSFFTADAPVDPHELSTALRATFGSEFGLVRVGKHKKNRAVRIP